MELVGAGGAAPPAEGGHLGPLEDVGETGGPGVESSPASDHGLHSLLWAGAGGEADGRHTPAEGHGLAQPEDGDVVVQTELVILRVSDDLADLQPQLALLPGGEAVVPQHQVGRVRAVGGRQNFPGGEEGPATVRQPGTGGGQ